MQRFLFGLTIIGLAMPILALASTDQDPAFVQAERPMSCEEFLDSGVWTPQVTPRSLAEEAQHLFYSKKLSTVSYEDLEGWRQLFFQFVPDGKVAMELGAGIGRAMSELLVVRRVRGIAVDTGEHVKTQDISAIWGGRPAFDRWAREDARNNWDRSQPLLGEYIPEIGFAEEVLLKYPNQIDRIWDTLGAFHYTPRRILLVERVYDALTASGEARLYCGNPPALRIARLMVRNFPKIFTLESLSPEMGGEYVLVIKKQPGLATFKSGFVDGKVLRWSTSLGVPYSVEIKKAPGQAPKSVTLGQ